MDILTQLRTACPAIDPDIIKALEVEKDVGGRVEMLVIQENRWLARMYAALIHRDEKLYSS